MHPISPLELSAWLADPQRGKPVLLDVREPWEYDICHLADARLMPMQTVPAQLEALDPEADTVVICHHGARSMQVAMFLEQRGFGRLYNLSGGVAGWARLVDPAMPQY